MKNKNQFYRKRVIVFGFEGKNNKTEMNYFSHFKPKDDKYILKCLSCGVTEPAGMINSIKNKRKDFDYKSREDLTFVFVDEDCDETKRIKIDNIKKKMPKDIVIIKSAPIFELWFLNHFCKTTKEYLDNSELIDDLKRYISDYNKSQDYFGLLKEKTDEALENSAYQKQHGMNCTSTDVADLINKVIIFKE